MLRYSYLVSLHVDLETQQTDTYAACIEQEAITNPRRTCIEIMTTPGYFDLYSNDAKAEVCTTATHSLDEIRTKQAKSDNPVPIDSCATLTSHIFQSYSYYLQDMTDGIIGALTEKMTETLHKASADYLDQKAM